MLPHGRGLSHTCGPERSLPCSAGPLGPCAAFREPGSLEDPCIPRALQPLPVLPPSTDSALPYPLSWALLARDPPTTQCPLIPPSSPRLWPHRHVLESCPPPYGVTPGALGVPLGDKVSPFHSDALSIQLFAAPVFYPLGQESKCQPPGRQAAGWSSTGEPLWAAIGQCLL